MTYPLVQELAAEGIPVRLTCGVLGFSTQAFYKWRRQPCSQRDLDDAHLTNALVDLHEDDPEFGYRFLTDELQAAGHKVGERRVWRLCRQQRLWSTTVKKGRHGKRPGPAVHDDLVQRQFRSDRPDAVWLTDITEHPTSEGKLYCCAIKDCFSNRIVGYSLGDRMTAQLAITALRTAIARRQPTGTLLVHSDRGGQYLSIRYADRLAENEIVASVGSRGDSYDNALAESFNGLYKWELIYRQGPWRGLDDVEFATMTYVDWFNHRRLHGEITDSPDYTTPAEHEADYYRQTTPALEPATP